MKEAGRGAWGRGAWATGRGLGRVSGVQVRAFGTSNPRPLTLGLELAARARGVMVRGGCPAGGLPRALPGVGANLIVLLSYCPEIGLTDKL